MMHHLKSAWGGFLLPMLQRPKRLQVAALCHRGSGDDKRVLLITSRDTGRWILPKGWPIEGLDSPGAALQEAWEEAGVSEGRASPEPVGRYTYEKRLRGGLSVPVETLVYDVEVGALARDYPEADARNRQWVTFEEAAGMVDEPDLQNLLRTYDPERQLGA